jgi:hypothetical protein
MQTLPDGFKRYTEEDFLAEKATLFDPDPINPQVYRLKEGKSRADAVSMYNKRDINNKAHSTKYNIGGSVADMVEDLLIRGFIYPIYKKRGVVPACYLSTFEGNQVILVGIERDYFKLLHGEL